MTRFKTNSWFWPAPFLFIAIFAFSLPFMALASATEGSISVTNFTSPLLDHIGSLYWNTPIPYEVTVTDAKLAGYVWGDSLGWIILNCSNTSSCASGNFGVRNDGEGNLSGYAWGEHAGWVSFNCANPETDNCASNNDACVVIDADGKFSGYAWAENFGWVKFDCAAGSASCVQTDWRPASVRPAPASAAGRSRGQGLSFADRALFSRSTAVDPQDLAYFQFHSDAIPATALPNNLSAPSVPAAFDTSMTPAMIVVASHNTNTILLIGLILIVILAILIYIIRRMSKRRSTEHVSGLI